MLRTWSNHVLTRFCQSLWKCWLGMTLLCRTILPCGRVNRNGGGGIGEEEGMTRRRRMMRERSLPASRGLIRTTRWTTEAQFA